MNISTTKHSYYAVFIAAICLFLCGACGKSGMPSPKKTQDTFTITKANVSFVNSCLAVQATVSGAIVNLDSVTLEVAPIQSYDDCPGCPFVAQEYMTFSSADIQLDPQTGTFMLSYCPLDQASLYRWRIVGKNVFLGLPHATTTPQVASQRQ